MEAYMDNAATTPVLSEVCDIIIKTMEIDFGNPSSKHTKGIIAERYITNARDIISSYLKCEPKEIIFTSGGTEANNMALIGTAIANRRKGKHIVTTCIEHASIYEPLSYLEDMGYEVTYLPVDNVGRVSAESLEKAVRNDTLIVSIMHVNNEIGSVQDIKKLCDIVKKKNPKTLFHVDAIQSFGKYKIIPKRLGIDMLSVSGHKINGPKGSGFLYIKDKTKISPILWGGGQQKGMRSGTENVPAIAGLGVAADIIYKNHNEKLEHLYSLKQRLIEKMSFIDGATINGVTDIDLKETAPHIVSVSFKGIKSEVMLHALAQKGVYVSSGSACSSNNPKLSGTLKAIGVSDELLDATLRYSFSMLTTEEEIDYAVKITKEILPQLRKFIKH